MKIKLTWLLVFKAFIVIFWIFGMVSFISMAIDSRKTLLELLTRWDYALIMVILLGCLSVVLDFFFKEKKIMIDYFLIVFFCLQCFLFINICMEYIGFLKYGFIFTDFFFLIRSSETIYLALWFVYFGFALCGITSYFQKNYKRAILCFAFCFINFIPFAVFVRQIIFSF